MLLSDFLKKHNCYHEFISNFDKNHSRMWRTNRDGAINYAFNWRASPQGHSYWSDIHDMWQMSSNCENDMQWLYTGYSNPEEVVSTAEVCYKSNKQWDNIRLLITVDELDNLNQLITDTLKRKHEDGIINILDTTITNDKKYHNVIVFYTTETTTPKEI
jgi:hypothetical protein